MMPAMRSTHTPLLCICTQERRPVILSLFINHRVSTHISAFILYTQSLLNKKQFAEEKKNDKEKLWETM